MQHFAGSPTAAFKQQQGKGRRAGIPNKTHAVVRWGLVEAYRQLGGVDGLVKWGKSHRTEFYQLLGKLIPAEIADQHGVSDTKLQVVILPANAQSMPKAIDAQVMPQVREQSGIDPAQ